MRIHLASPSILESRTVKAIAFNKSAFQYYPGRHEDGRDLPEVTDTHLARMAEIMNPWFDKHLKGRGVRAFVFKRDHKFWVVIRHGKAAVREGKHEEDGESGAAFFRPQKHDVVIYDAASDLLGINAETKGRRISTVTRWAILSLAKRITSVTGTRSPLRRSALSDRISSSARTSKA